MHHKTVFSNIHGFVMTDMEVLFFGASIKKSPKSPGSINIEHPENSVMRIFVLQTAWFYETLGEGFSLSNINVV